MDNRRGKKVFTHANEKSPYRTVNREGRRGNLSTGGGGKKSSEELDDPREFGSVEEREASTSEFCLRHSTKNPIKGGERSPDVRLRKNLVSGKRGNHALMGGEVKISEEGEVGLKPGKKRSLSVKAP